MFGMFFFLPQFVQGVLGLSPIRTGLASLPLTAALFLATQLGSRGLTSGIAATTQMAGGVALSTAGLLLLTRLSPGTSYWTVLVSLVLVGIGNGTAFVPFTSAALSGVAPQDSGAASGLVNVTQQLGGTLGVAVLVTVFGSAARHATAVSTAAGDGQAQALHVFTYAVDRAFLASARFLVAAVVMILVGVRPIRTR